MDPVAEAVLSIMIHLQEKVISAKRASLNYTDLSSFTCGMVKILLQAFKQNDSV